jgi:hypothetical protein
VVILSAFSGQLREINMDGTPSVSMRAILLLTILMTSGDFDKQKQEQFEKERPLFQRNHQKRFAAVTHFKNLPFLLL